ncbi:topology modulation protein [Sphingomicrobium flavum]|uniref:topology modulation protein n=1 Tax=Sphingomicrobium flavum TaxID=1229164 RepID=UPI0021AD6587|nr:topology modulation protein [Sphingomicrobium flavum]
MRRIMVMGRCGAGKSTLARVLAERLGIKAHHLDQLSFAAGWVQKPAYDWHPKLEAIVAQDHWVIDGNDSATLSMRLARADSVIFLDFGRWRCLWQVLRRISTHHGRTRPDMAPDCPERLNLPFLIYVLTWDGSPRRKNLVHLVGHEDKIIRLTSPKEVATWLEKLESSAP